MKVNLWLLIHKAGVCEKKSHLRRGLGWLEGKKEKKKRTMTPHTINKRPIEKQKKNMG